MTAIEIATEHYRYREQLADEVAADGAALWRRLSPSNLDSWQSSALRLLLVLTGAQQVAARQADEFVEAALAEQGVDVAPAGQVAATALAGVASDGRSLEGLLWVPVTTTKMAIRQGHTIPRAMAAGQATLDMLLRTQVADAGRVADGVAITARPRVGYVRMLGGRGCSRCVVLAGRFYRYNAGFRRHPRCKCIHVPAEGSRAARSEGLVDDPRAYFESLTEEEQNKAFTRAGAQAIRDGADINQVVNARRGMASAGVTTEGATRHGLAGSRLRGRARLMPEEIYRQARSHSEAVRMLRQHGYII